MGTAERSEIDALFGRIGRMRRRRGGLFAPVPSVRPLSGILLARLADACQAKF